MAKHSNFVQYMTNARTSNDLMQPANEILNQNGVKERIRNEDVARAFIISLTIEKFGVGLDSDIVLYSLRLLTGYENIVAIGVRREKFLRESGYTGKKQNKTADSEPGTRTTKMVDTEKKLYEEIGKQYIPTIPDADTIKQCLKEAKEKYLGDEGVKLPMPSYLRNGVVPVVAESAPESTLDSTPVLEAEAQQPTASVVNDGERFLDEDLDSEAILASPVPIADKPVDEPKVKKRKKWGKSERARKRYANRKPYTKGEKIGIAIALTFAFCMMILIVFYTEAKYNPKLPHFPTQNDIDSDKDTSTDQPGEFEKPAMQFENVNISDTETQERQSWGDNSGDNQGYSQRQTYTTSEIESGALGSNATVFNSIFDDTIDERNFVSVCESSALDSGQNADWQKDSIEVKDGEVYTIRLYVHNDNLNGFRSVAEKTKVKYVLPTEISNEQEIRGYITSSNASPSEYWSSVLFESQTNVFSLEYIEDSFKICNDATGSRGHQLGTFQSDNYTMIGYKYMDGEYPGGSQYASYIYLQVRVVFEAQCEIKTTQRILNSPDKSWYKTMEAEIGDLIECQFYYRNTSDVRQENIMIRYVLPDNLEYVPDSTVLYNSNYQSGVGLKGDAVTTSGINIGHYKPQGNAYVRFTVRVIDKSLATGWNCLTNWGTTTVEGKVAKDSTAILVRK